jgi:phage-related protein
MASAGTASIDVTGDFSGFTKGVDEAGKGFLGKAGGWGKAAAALIGPALAIGAVVGLAEIGDQFDSAFDKIRVGTGATGDVLNGLQDSFKNVFSQVPASMDTVSEAITGISQRLGLTGKPLEDLSKQFINLSRITGTDLKGNVDTITRVFGDWGISTADQAGAMDKLFRATQASGIGIGDLSSSIVQFGAPFRNLGFTFDQSTALLAQFNKTGVNTDTVIAGLKKGVGTLAKAGEDVPSTFKRVVEEITALGPGTEATGKAIALFGQRAGPDLADAITGGKFSIDEMLATIGGGSDTINQAASDTDDWREKLNLLKNKALVALEPVAAAVFDAIGRGADWVSVSIDKFSKSDAWGTIQDDFHAAFDWVTKTGVPALVVGFQWLSGIIVPALGTAFDWISNTMIPAVMDAFGSVKKWFTSNWPTIQAVFQKAWDGIQTGFEWLIDHKPVLIGVLTALALILFGPVVTAIAAVVLAWTKFEGFREVVEGLTTWITQTAWPALQQFFDGIVQKITEFAQGWSDRWEAIKTSVETIITALTVAVGIALAPLIFIWTNAHDQIMAVVQAVWSFIGAYIQAALNVILGIVDIVLGLLSGDWSRAWDGVKQVLQGVWDGIVALVTLSITMVQQILLGALAVIAALWSAAWAGVQAVLAGAWAAISTGVSTGISTVVGWLTGLPGQAVAAIAALPGLYLAAGTAAINALWDGAMAAWRLLSGWLATLPAAMVAALGNIGSFFSQVGRDIIDAIANAIRGASGLIAGAIKDAALGALGSIGGVIGGAAGAIGGILGFDTGGVVPGPVGAPRFAVVHGGEEVLTYSQRAEAYATANDAQATTGHGMRQPLVVNNYGVATDPQHLARITAEEMTWALRTRAA